MLGFRRAGTLIACGLVSAIASVGVLAGAALAAPVWLAPTTLAAAGGGADASYVAAPRVVSNAEGDSVAAWVHYDKPSGITSVEAAYRRAGGSFGAPTPLSADPAPGAYAPAPDVGIDAAGNATVVWLENDGTTRVVRTASRTASADFGAPRSLSASDPAWYAYAPRIAVNAAGVAVVVWYRFDGSVNVVQATRRAAPGGAFEAPGDISSPAVSVASPRVALDPAGNAVAVWVQSAPPANIQMAARPAGAPGFTGAVAVTSAGSGQYATMPQVAMDGEGRATIVWAYYTASKPVIQYRTRFADGKLGGTAQASPSAVTANEPRLVVTPDNTAILAYTVYDGTTSPARYVIQSAVRPANQSFGDYQILSAAETEVRTSELTLAANGDAFASWIGSDNGADALIAARRPAGGSFAGARVVEAGDPAAGRGISTVHMLAADGEGNATAVYATNCLTGPCARTMRAAAFDAAPPSMQRVTVPGAATAGDGVAMSVDATDRISAVSVGWDFGDGTTAAGPNAAHAYGSAGTYTVTVTATDAAGNRSAATRQISVAAPVVPIAAAETPKPAGPPAPPTTGASTAPSHVTLVFKAKPGKLSTTFSMLELSGVPAGAKVTAICKPKGKAKCPVKPFTKAKANGTVKLASFLKKALRPGTVIEIRVTKPGLRSVVKRLTINRGRPPRMA